VTFVEPVPFRLLFGGGVRGVLPTEPSAWSFSLLGNCSLRNRIVANDIGGDIRSGTDRGP